MASVPPQPDDLPDALARDLNALYARDVRVPDAIDASILADARAGFARRHRFRLALRGAVVASAAAAAAALVVLAVRLAAMDPVSGPSPVAQHQPSPAAPQPTGPAAPAVAGKAEDVDHSGRVDILDAFVVARLIDVQGELDRQAYDVNGDGKVDRADVDRIAMAAVDTSPRAGDDGRVQ